MDAEFLMTLDETAAFLRTKPSTLYGWRYQGTGPRGIKAGGRVLYRRSDVDAWLESQADQPAPAA